LRSVAIGASAPLVPNPFPDEVTDEPRSLSPGNALDGGRSPAAFESLRLGPIKLRGQVEGSDRDHDVDSRRGSHSTFVTTGGPHDPSMTDSFGQYMRSMRRKTPFEAGSRLDNLQR
jgi:hypothetical protein